MSSHNESMVKPSKVVLAGCIMDGLLLNLGAIIVRAHILEGIKVSKK